MQKRVFYAAIAAGLVSGLTLVATAGASPAQNQTFHFNALVDQLGTPTGQTTNLSNCPAPVLNDFVDINATGNGVVHQTINGAGDVWFTTTFTGTATITFYPNGTVDSNGNVISVSGTPDMQVTGHLTQWFGFEGNKQNAVAHGTIDFQGLTVYPNPGTPITFHNVTHAAWLPGANPNGPPSFAFNVASC